MEKHYSISTDLSFKEYLVLPWLSITPRKWKLMIYWVVFRPYLVTLGAYSQFYTQRITLGGI